MIQWLNVFAKTIPKNCLQTWNLSKNCVRTVLDGNAPPFAQTPHALHHPGHHSNPSGNCPGTIEASLLPLTQAFLLPLSWCSTSSQHHCPHARIGCKRSSPFSCSNMSSWWGPHHPFECHHCIQWQTSDSLHQNTDASNRSKQLIIYH